MSLKVAIVGASGYAGAELARLVEAHPSLDLVTVTANTQVGERLGDFAEVVEKAELRFVETTKENLLNHDVVFIALPHTKSAEVASWLPDDVLVLDCGADFRLKSASEYEKFYGVKHPGTWAYGLPELLVPGVGKQRENLANVKRIAVPGCNATAVTLAYTPLLAAGLVDATDLVATLSVGTSGAGRNAKVNTEHFDSAYAYQVGGIHRHIPEIIQNLAGLTDAQIKLTFTPVLVPLFRGILAVSTATVLSGVTEQQIRQAFLDAYEHEAFVQLLDQGQQADVSQVANTNFCQLSFVFDETSGRVVVTTALDNLVKGTAGGAVQSMNLALGINEGLGI